MSELRKVLLEYGADVDDIMRRFVDDEALYIECLGDTLEDDAFNGLEEALKADNLDVAFRKTHSLKGTALNMGVTAFYNSVVDVIEDLRGGGTEALPELIEKMLYEKNRIVDIYEKFKYMLG